jgi:hypothetical protein
MGDYVNFELLLDMSTEKNSNLVLHNLREDYANSGMKSIQ